MNTWAHTGSKVASWLKVYNFRIRTCIYTEKEGCQENWYEPPAAWLLRQVFAREEDSYRFFLGRSYTQMIANTECSSALYIWQLMALEQLV